MNKSMQVEICQAAQGSTLFFFFVRWKKNDSMCLILFIFTNSFIQKLSVRRGERKFEKSLLFTLLNLFKKN